MKIGLVILGCDKNTADAEHLAGLLTSRGHEVAAEGAQEQLDAALILSCGFIRDAREENYAVIADLCAFKKQKGNPRRVVVAGCLPQYEQKELAARFPDVDAWLGVGQLESWVEALEKLDGGEGGLAGFHEPDMAESQPLPRQRLDGLGHAFLKIADGCDHRCAFCAIPSIKGPYRSVPLEWLVEEARALVEIGVKELVLIGQDLAPYGRDLEGEVDLPRLLRELCALEGDFRVRMLYLYPSGLTDALLEVMSSEPKICPYLDIPLQHLSPKVLKKMGRPDWECLVEERIALFRKALPDLTLRTTFIVGFPGEGEGDFKELLEGMKRLRFDWMGAFLFSPEKGTAAESLPGPVNPAKAQRRLDKLMKAQQVITQEKLAEQEGRTLRVLVEGVDAETGLLVGRSCREAPEVDGCVFLEDGPELSQDQLGTGDFVLAEILEADVYDLFGRLTAGDGGS